jgi:chemotaxis protein CheC
MTPISELQRDALGEIFNLGVGRAAASLSQIVNDEVLLTAPEVRVISPAEVLNELSVNGSTRCSSVSQTFSGPFDANALLIFPENNALKIVGLMMGQYIPPDQLAEYEQETMCEVGNIILNACISALADMFGAEFESTLPVHRFGDYQSINLTDSTDRQVILLIQVDLIISSQKIYGHILYLLSVSSLNSLIASVDRYLKAHGLA